MSSQITDGLDNPSLYPLQNQMQLYGDLLPFTIYKALERVHDENNRTGASTATFANGRLMTSRYHDSHVHIFYELNLQTCLPFLGSHSEITGTQETKSAFISLHRSLSANV
jgi:hypothetical protein